MEKKAALVLRALRSDLDSVTDLFDDLRVEPEGFVYRDGLIGAAQEAELAARIATLELKPFDFGAYQGNRRVAYFGGRYDYGARRLEDAPARPDWLEPIADAVAAAFRIGRERLVQTLVTEYAPGAGIGWHRDRPQFGRVFGVSLLAPCLLRLRRRDGERWRRISHPLAPRSAYQLTGPARLDWQHSITPMDRLRYSITFRTLAADDVSAPSDRARKPG